MINIWYVLKKELKELICSKKSLLMMLLVPFLVPFLIIGMSYIFNLEKINNNYKIGFSYQLNEIEKEIIKNLSINPVYDNIDKLEKMLFNNEINVYIEKNNNHYYINSNNENDSIIEIVLSEKYLTLYKEYLYKKELSKYQIYSSLENIITFEKRIVSSNNFYQLYINFYGFIFIIMAITVSATYPATDATAGEKERGTLETLLTFPIKIKDIIFGKFLSVSISSIITGIIGFILMIISLFIVNHTFAISKYINLIPSFNILLVILVIIIIYSFLISGLCLIVASFTNTFKEAQSSLTLITFLSFIPGMLVFSIDFSNTLFLSIIPFLNIYLIYFDLINGIINYQEVILMILSSIIIIVLILFLMIRNYNKEKVLF